MLSASPSDYDVRGCGGVNRSSPTKHHKVFIAQDGPLRGLSKCDGIEQRREKPLPAQQVNTASS